MYYWWGMSFMWWFIWIAALAIFFSFATPVRRSNVRRYDDPLAILRRRYAAGDITTEEYEERRSRLEEAGMRDRNLEASRRPAPVDRHQPA